MWLICYLSVSTNTSWRVSGTTQHLGALPMTVFVACSHIVYIYIGGGVREMNHTKLDILLKRETLSRLVNKTAMMINRHQLEYEKIERKKE